MNTPSCPIRYDSPSTKTRVVGSPMRRTLTAPPLTDATRPTNVGTAPKPSVIVASNAVEKSGEVVEVAQAEPSAGRDGIRIWHRIRVERYVEKLGCPTVDGIRQSPRAQLPCNDRGPGPVNEQIATTRSPAHEFMIIIEFLILERDNVGSVVRVQSIKDDLVDVLIAKRVADDHEHSPR